MRDEVQMDLLKTEIINHVKIYIYVTQFGMFVAADEPITGNSGETPIKDSQHYIDAADRLTVLIDRVEKKVKRATRIRIAVPFSRLETLPPPPEAGPDEPNSFIFRDYIVTGQHRSTGNWLVYDVRRDRTTQETIYRHTLAYPPTDTIPPDEIKKYIKLITAQHKVRNLLKRWHERNRIYLLDQAEQALNRAQLQLQPQPRPKPRPRPRTNTNHG